MFALVYKVLALLVSPGPHTLSFHPANGPMHRSHARVRSSSTDYDCLVLYDSVPRRVPRWSSHAFRRSGPEPLVELPVIGNEPPCGDCWSHERYPWGACRGLVVHRKGEACTFTPSNDC